MAGRRAKTTKINVDNIDENEEGKFIAPLLQEEVELKESGRPNVIGIANDVIPEHIVQRPTLDFDALKDNPQSVEKEDEDEDEDETPKQSTRKQKTYNTTPIEKPEPFNPSASELSKVDLKRGAEQMADMALGLYQWLHELAKKGIVLDKEKQQSLALKKKFDLRALDVKLPMTEPDTNGHYETMTLRDFLDDFNSNVSEALTVSDEWIAEVRPVLVRMLSKSGLVLTDGQFLIYKIGEDVVKKSTTLFTLVKMKKDVITVSMEFLAKSPNFADVKRDLDKQIIEQQREIERLTSQHKEAKTSENVKITPAEKVVEKNNEPEEVVEAEPEEVVETETFED